MRTVAAVALVGAGLAFFACGDGSETSSSSSSSSSSSGASGSTASSSSASSGGGGGGGACRANFDCTVSGQICIGGNVPEGCGGALLRECEGPGACDGGTKFCSIEGCGSISRCVDPQCASDTDTSCPVNQVCRGRLCVAKPCTKDDECSSFCVNGVCSAKLGVCGVQQLYP